MEQENFSDYCKNFLDSGIRIPLHEATYKWGDFKADVYGIRIKTGRKITGTPSSRVRIVVA